MKYIGLKEELKQLAKELKELKYKRDHWYDTDKLQWEYQYSIMNAKYEFRHKHIAYCMLRGRKYEEIEQYCRVAPDWYEIDRIKALYEETICASA